MVPAAGRESEGKYFEISKIADRCNFEAVLDYMLRDRIVRGLRNPRVRRKLLAKPTLTRNEAKEVSPASEMAALNAQQMQQQSQRTDGDREVYAFRGRRQEFRGRKEGRNYVKDVPEDNSLPERCGKTGHRGQQGIADFGTCGAPDAYRKDIMPLSSRKFDLVSLARRSFAKRECWTVTTMTCVPLNCEHRRLLASA